MNYIRSYAETYGDWDQLLLVAMLTYSTSVYKATKFTPFEIVFGNIRNSIQTSLQPKTEY